MRLQRFVEVPNETKGIYMQYDAIERDSKSDKKELAHVAIVGRSEDPKLAASGPSRVKL